VAKLCAYLNYRDAPAKDFHGKPPSAGATSVFEPEETEWGTWRARVLDPKGYEWSFGPYQPGRSW